MKMNEILARLTLNDDVCCSNHDYVFKRQLKEVVAGVPVYSLALYGEDIERHIEFDSLNELEEFSDFNVDCIDLKKCKHCDEIPDGSYYHDEEMGQSFCSFDCLTEEFNKRFGFGNWSTMIDDPSHFFHVHIRITDEEAERTDNCIKVDGEYWRKYNVRFVPAYNAETVEHAFFESILD